MDISVFCQADAGSGIQRVVRNVSHELLRAAPEGIDVCFVAALKGQSGYRAVDRQWLCREDPPRPPPLHALSTLEVGPADHFLGLDLAPRIVASRWRHFVAWRRRGASLWFVVYDMLPVEQPQWFAPGSVRHFRRWLSTLAVVADGALCISDVVREAFGHWLTHEVGLPQGAIPAVVIPLGSELGVPAGQRSDDDGAALPTEVARSGYVLMVGTLEPRKAHAEVLDAFEGLWAEGEGCALVIVGKPGWMVGQLLERIRAHPESGRRLMWLSQAGDSTLAALYAGCKGLVMASYGEGYGLPVVEALRHGKPVLARDLPIFREVSRGGGGMSYFGSEDGRGLPSVLKQWIRTIDAPGRFTPPPLAPWALTCRQLLQAMGLATRSGPVA